MGKIQFENEGSRLSIERTKNQVEIYVEDKNGHHAAITLDINDYLQINEEILECLIINHP